MLTINTLDTQINPKLLLGSKFQKKLKLAHESLHNIDKSMGTGWVDYPKEISKSELSSLKETAQKIQEMCDLFVVVGTGGSVEGTKAIINSLDKKTAKTKIVFVGNSLETKEIEEVLDEIKTHETCINVISKSGTTTETLIVFHLIEQAMKKKYKKGEYKKRIFVTTDYELGSLRELASKEGYASFVIPRTIGGRFSVFTPVGLLPLAVLGVNIEKLIAGAKTATKENSEFNINSPASKLAIARYFLHTKLKKSVEVVTSFSAQAGGLFEWYKQLFNESEGKNKKGLFVTSLSYPSSLHSAGQFIQQGNPILFETFLDIEKSNHDITLEKINSSSTIASLEKASVNKINQAIELSTKQAHKDGKVPMITLSFSELTEETVGEFMQTVMLACGMSALLLGVNPFDQPGVEQYKTHFRSICEQN